MHQITKGRMTEMMQHRILAAPVCGLLLLLLNVCYGQTTITPEQALDAVRVFEGNPVLQLQNWELKEDEWNDVPYYDIDAVETLRSSWTVDALTGEVTAAVYYDALMEEGSDEPSGPLTQDQCRQMALDYARSKYSGLDTMGFELHDQDWEGNGWRFVWNQRVAYGAWTSNAVAVYINPVDGAIGAYISNRVPTPVPDEPQITAQQAIDTVKVATGIVTVYSAEPSLGVGPDGTCWTFEIQGGDAQGAYLIYSAGVNAVTGEIIGLDAPMGSPSPPKPFGKPSVITGESTSIRDLAAKVPGAKVHWLGKEGAKVFVGKERYTLVPGKDTIESTGGTIKLSAKIKLVDGRLMVPSGLLDVLKSASAPKKARQSAAR